jgi:hypothetical protein
VSAARVLSVLVRMMRVLKCIYPPIISLQP